MRDEDKWPTIHAYRHAVALGEAPAITCPDCESELLPVVGPDAFPMFKCFSCNAGWKPGQNMWDQILANLNEVADNIIKNRSNIE